MNRALLIGKEPGGELGFSYTDREPYDAVVIGSLELGQLLRFREERVLNALAQGKSVYLYTPGLPECPKNRALSGSLTAAQRELKNWGVLFTDGGRKRLVTAEEARALRSRGAHPGPGCAPRLRSARASSAVISRFLPPSVNSTPQFFSSRWAAVRLPAKARFLGATGRPGV